MTRPLLYCQLCLPVLPIYCNFFKVKSAFTRQYNKESHKTPYAVHQTAKKAKGKAVPSEGVLIQEGDDDNTGEADVEDDDDNDVTKDAMIKVKKEPSAGSSGKGKSKSTSNKASTKETSSKAKSGKGKKK